MFSPTMPLSLGNTENVQPTSALKSSKTQRILDGSVGKGQNTKFTPLPVKAVQNSAAKSEARYVQVYSFQQFIVAKFTFTLPCTRSRRALGEIGLNQINNAHIIETKTPKKVLFQEKIQTTEKKKDKKRQRRSNASTLNTPASILLNAVLDKTRGVKTFEEPEANSKPTTPESSPTLQKGTTKRVVLDQTDSGISISSIPSTGINRHLVRLLKLGLKNSLDRFAYPDNPYGLLPTKKKLRSKRKFGKGFFHEADYDA